MVGALNLAAAILALGLLPVAARWRLPRWGHPDRSALRDSGLRLSLGQWELLRLAAAVIGLIVGALAGLPVPGAAVFAIAPSAVARVRAGAARERARGALAPLLLATYASLRSGLSLPEALRRAVTACDDAIARRPFDGLLARFDLGDPLDAALELEASRSGDIRVSEAMQTLALGVSERMPVDRAASLLTAVADVVRYDDEVASEVRARSAGIRVQLYLLAAVVPILSAYLLATMPGLAATLGGTLGRTVLVPGAVFLEVAGIVVSRRIIRSVVA